MVNLGNSLRRGGGQGGFKSNYNHMKSSMTQSDTQRDDYNPCEDSIWPLKNKL